jgi:hypothetical protein
MPHSRDKKAAEDDQEPAPQEPESAPGLDLPDPDSVVEKRYFTSPKGNRYEILVTDEGDVYDKPERPRKKRRKRRRLQGNRGLRKHRPGGA